VEKSRASCIKRVMIILLWERTTIATEKGIHEIITTRKG
jgi:hypothetical protein